MAWGNTSLHTLIKPFRSPLQFAAAGFVWSAVNDAVAVALSYSNGLHGTLFAVKGIHNQYLLLLHVALGYVVFPSVWAFFAWTGQAPRRMLRDLRREGAVTEGAGFAEGNKAVYPGFSRRSWTFLYIMGALLVLAGVYSLWSNPPAHEPGTAFYIRIHLPSTVVLWSMLWLILWRIAEAIWALNKTFRAGKVCLRPFHADRVGGFGALKRYAREFLFFVGFVFFGLVIDLLQTKSIRQEPRDVILLVYIWAFILLVPVLFWGTLWPSHTAMSRERDRILHALMPDDWQRTSFGSGADAASMKRELERAEAARRLHDAVMAFPAWPYRFGPDVLVPLGESFAAAAVAHLLVNAFFHPR
jgi:hypothetical protein